MTSPTHKRVQPGDLIRADDWNLLIDQLVAMNGRIEYLEGIIPGGNGQVTITDLPADIHVDDVLSIGGLNFGGPLECVVTFDGGNRVTTFLGGNDRLLMLRVPPIAVPPWGVDVMLAVSRANKGSDSRRIRVKRVVNTLPEGTIVGVGPPRYRPGDLTLKSGSTYVVTMPIEIDNLSLEETFLLNLTPPSGWSAAMVTDVNGGAELIPPQVKIPATVAGQRVSRRDVFLRFTIPAGIVGTPPAIMRLSTTGQTNPRMTYDTSFPFNVNSPTPGQQLITFNVTKTFPNNTTVVSNEVVFDLATLNGLTPIGGGSAANIRFTTNNLPPCPVPGAKCYGITLSAPVTGSGWTWSLSSDLNAAPVLGADFGHDDAAPHEVFVYVSGTAAGPATFELTVTGPGDGNRGTVRQTIRGQ